MITLLARLQPKFIYVLRIAVFIVMGWIGGLKAFQYEADGIVPFVANSPLMSFFYDHPDQYQEHKNKEGEHVPANIEWHLGNGTYTFSYFLGAFIVFLGFLNLLGIWFKEVGLIAGLLTVGMSLVTLSFLITTPEAYVPNLGGENFGFPYLSGAGRLVIKDVIMLGAGLVLASESAAQFVSGPTPKTY
ncbi:DUF417 family protein [Echinicola sp. 20G]|uniref:DUF417 family protein n=1 Tax=Echinicola sp. 20G TaxID=2781961 RepID=UPI001F3D83FF|nr:DUF417 family protein [Echinicola sp. 20G]